MKYSKALLEPIVKSSTSTSEVMRRLGLQLSGGTNSHLKKLFKKFDIDISHFLGQANNRGNTHKGGNDKLTPSEILVYDRHDGRRENVFRLKRAMLESGIPEQCSECGIPTEWNGKPLTLQIDHKDGNGTNNFLHNLRFLCPCCHSQTPNFGIKNRKVLSAVEELYKMEDRAFLKALKATINSYS